MGKLETRLRRATKIRAKIKGLKIPRLSIHRTSRHIYAQLIDANGKILAFASTVNPEIRKEIKYYGNIAAARIVGKYIAEKGKKVGLDKIAFDRSGFKYHGRVKALAEAAREGGLKF